MKKSVKRTIWISIIVFTVIVGIISMVKYCEQERKKAKDPVINTIKEGLGEDVTLDEFDRDQMSAYYWYFLNTYEKNVIAQLEAALNSMQNKSQNKIRVAIWDDVPGGMQSIFVLKNYSEQGKMTEDGKFTYLVICDLSRKGSNTDFFLNPEIYTALSDIRYLEIADSMQQLAEEAGIDWYEVWPELESAKQYTRGELGREIYTDILRRD